MTSRLDEEQLVQALRGNDREALAAAYDEFGGAAYGLALKLLSSQAEAEDVVQEAFLALWRQADRIDPDRGMRQYLLAIVHNRCVDLIRRRARRAGPRFDPENTVVAAQDDPEKEAITAVEAEGVRAALAALTPDTRHAVELVYFRGLTINEAAQRMQVPLGTAKSRLRLALGQLRRRLETA